MRPILAALLCAILAFAPADAGTRLLLGAGSGAPTAGGGGGAATTWDTGFNGGLTLSNGNLTATSNVASFKTTRSTTSKTTGKVYLEVTNTLFDTNGFIMGVGTSSASSGNFPGTDASAYGFQCAAGGDGEEYYNNSYVGSPWASCVQGDVVGVAIDVDNKLIWLKNLTIGSGWNSATGGTQDPGTGQGGLSMSSISGAFYFMWGGLDNPGHNSATVNFGATSFTGTAPSGFSVWN